MDSVSPDVECIAGDQRSATGANTFFGNTFGNLTETKDWLAGLPDTSVLRPHHRQRLSGYGHPS